MLKYVDRLHWDSPSLPRYGKLPWGRVSQAWHSLFLFWPGTCDGACSFMLHICEAFCLADPCSRQASVQNLLFPLWWTVPLISGLLKNATPGVREQSIYSVVLQKPCILATPLLSCQREGRGVTQQSSSWLLFPDRMWSDLSNLHNFATFWGFEYHHCIRTIA